MILTARYTLPNQEEAVVTAIRASGGVISADGPREVEAEFDTGLWPIERAKLASNLLLAGCCFLEFKDG